MLNERLGEFSQRVISGACCRPGRLLDVEGDPLGVTGPLLPRDNQEYRSPSEDSGLGPEMPRTRSTFSFFCDSPFFFFYCYYTSSFLLLLLLLSSSSTTSFLLLSVPLFFSSTSVSNYIFDFISSN